MKSRICYLECPLSDFIEDYPVFLDMLYQTYSKSMIDECLKHDDYIVRYNGCMLEIGRQSDKWNIK